MSSRLSRGEYYVKMALLAAERSTCARARVGAIIIQDNRVVMTGYNGTPAGQPHCVHKCFCNGDGCPPRAVPIDGHAPGCSLVSQCTQAVHAEANAISWCARLGVPTLGARMVVTLSPCLPCAQLIVSAGITELGYLSKYRDTEGLDFIRRAQVHVSQED